MTYRSIIAQVIHSAQSAQQAPSCPGHFSFAGSTGSVFVSSPSSSRALFAASSAFLRLIGVSSLASVSVNPKSSLTSCHLPSFIFVIGSPQVCTSLVPARAVVPSAAPRECSNTSVAVCRSSFETPSTACGLCPCGVLSKIMQAFAGLVLLLAKFETPLRVSRQQRQPMVLEGRISRCWLLGEQYANHIKD